MSTSFKVLFYNEKLSICEATPFIQQSEFDHKCAGLQVMSISLINK